MARNLVDMKTAAGSSKRQRVADECQLKSLLQTATGKPGYMPEGYFIELNDKACELLVESFDEDDLADAQAVQGHYWLITSHNGCPIYKQAPSDDTTNNKELILAWVTGPSANSGWYISSSLIQTKHELATTQVYAWLAGSSHHNLKKTPQKKSQAYSCS